MHVILLFYNLILSEDHLGKTGTVSIEALYQWQIEIFFLFRIACAMNNMYTEKLLFHQSPIRHSDYAVTTTVTI